VIAAKRDPSKETPLGAVTADSATSKKSVENKTDHDQLGTNTQDHAGKKFFQNFFNYVKSLFLIT